MPNHRKGVCISLFLRATPTGVAIRGAIFITAKMTPKLEKSWLQWRLHRRWQNAIRVCGVPYLAPLEREVGGCKISVDGYCFGKWLSTAIFHFKPYKITENERENERKQNPCLLVLVKNPSFSNPSFPESTSPRAAGSRTLVVQNAVWRKRKKEGEEEEKKEGDEEQRRRRRRVRNLFKKMKF